MKNNIKLYANIRERGIISAEDANEFFTGNAAITTVSENIGEITVDLSCCPLPYGYDPVLNAKPSAFTDIPVDGKIQNVLSRVQFSPFWSRPSYETDLSQIPDNVQNLLIRCDDCYISVLPLCCDDFYAQISPSQDKNTLRISLSAYFEGAAKLCGTAAVISKSDNPNSAVSDGFAYAIEKGYIKAVHKEKVLPDIFQKFGWCTWNAFYHDVTEKGIIEKVEELKSKNVPLKWIIIDDGWAMRTELNDWKITSFFEDKQKFPNGLKGCIDTLKKVYGIEKVGIWHSMTAHWYGIEKGSELFDSQKDNITQTNSGYFVPSAEKAYDFFDNWYRYLKTQGIDFLKIDTQGNVLEFFRGSKDCVKKCIEYQKNIDKAAFDNFGDAVINCMGMSNLNVFTRPYTILSRNSDDFFPDKLESFTSHIMQNAYNAVFHNCLYVCDYDMWWSNHPTAKSSSVLRAISGGPVYISDKVGDTESEYIRPIVDENGYISKLDKAAVPTFDCLFSSPENGVLKLYNKIGNEGVVAAFNLSDKTKSFTLSSADICESGEYAAYDFFNKSFIMLGSELLRLDVDKNDVRLFNIFRIENGAITVGDLDKYVSVGGNRRTIETENLINFSH